MLLNLSVLRISPAILRKRNEIYYKKYPQDIKRVRDILAYLEANEVTLPAGGRLSVSRFLQLGIYLGGTGRRGASLELLFS
jgi:hypothetical protein